MPEIRKFVPKPMASGEDIKHICAVLVPSVINARVVATEEAGKDALDLRFDVAFWAALESEVHERTGGKQPECIAVVTAYVREGKRAAEDRLRRYKEGEEW